jgi:hypothetical protein
LKTHAFRFLVAIASHAGNGSALDPRANRVAQARILRLNNGRKLEACATLTEALHVAEFPALQMGAHR